MDSAFEKYQDDVQARSQDWNLPFKNSPSLVIPTSIVRQLWGVTGEGKSTSSLEDKIKSRLALWKIRSVAFQRIRCRLRHAIRFSPPNTTTLGKEERTEKDNAIHQIGLTKATQAG